MRRIRASMSTGRDEAAARSLAGAPRRGLRAGRSASAKARFSAASTAMRSRALTLPASRMRAHLAVDVGHRLEQRVLAAVGAAEQVALAEDRDFDLLHPTLLSGSSPSVAPSLGSAGSRGRRSSSTSMRLRAAFRRERRLSRSLRHGGELRRQQRVGALQLLVPQKQALDPVGEFLDRGHDAPAKGEGDEL